MLCINEHWPLLYYDHYNTIEAIDNLIVTDTNYWLKCLKPCALDLGHILSPMPISLRYIAHHANLIFKFLELFYSACRPSLISIIFINNTNDNLNVMDINYSLKHGHGPCALEIFKILHFLVCYVIHANLLLLVLVTCIVLGFNFRPCQIFTPATSLSHWVNHWLILFNYLISESAIQNLMQNMLVNDYYYFYW